MGTRRTYTADQKTAALNMYREQGPTAVQKNLGIPKATVTKWAKAGGIPTVHTARTREATEARSVDLKARRQELTSLLLEDAHKLRTQLWSPAKVINFGGKDNTLAETTLDEPLFVDKKNIMAAVGIAIDRVVKLEAVDSDNGTAGAKSMLERLAEQLQGVPVADVGVDPGGEPEAAALPEDQ